MRFLSLALLFLFLTFSTACRDGGSETPSPAPILENNQQATGSPENQTPGGSDGGGGNAGESTEEDIIKAIDQAFQIAKDPRWAEYLESKIRTAYYWGNKISQKEKPYQIIFSIVDPKADSLLRLREQIGCINWGDEPVCEKKTAEIIRQAEEVDDPTYMDRVYKKIYLKYEDYCPANDKDNAEASVEVGNKEARICFSIFGLKRIPPDSINRHVLGLLFHELAHTRSHDETMAKKVEKVAIDAYEIFISDQNLPMTKLIGDDLFEFGILQVKWKVLGVVPYGEKPNYTNLNRKKVLVDLLVELGRQKQLATQILTYIDHFPNEVCEAVNMPIIKGSNSVQSSFVNYITNADSVIEYISLNFENPNLGLLQIFEEVEGLYESAGILYPCLDSEVETKEQ